MTTAIDLAQRLAAMERHQYGRPLSASADARIRRSLRSVPGAGRRLLGGAACAAALAMFLLSVRALSTERHAWPIHLAEDIGDAAMIEDAMAPSSDWATRPGGPSELP